MQAMKLSAALYVGSMVVAGAASAQTAVEWKVSDGGNGHWYQLCAQSQCFEVLGNLAATNGAHLATLSSLSEANFCGNLIRAKGVSVTYVGGSRAPNSDLYSGWTWVTGEPFVAGAVPWMAANPGCCAENEFWLCLSNDGRLGDVQQCSAVAGGGGLWEWDADCNGDGIVDYGQILSGELSDANANNIPDCCETGSCLIASNGSFEAGTPLNACASETVASGNALGTGWMVTAGSVQRVRASSACNTQGAPKFGDFFVDLLDAGEIRQAIATTPGKSYRLTFWLSGDCAGGPATKRVAASLGSVTQTFEHACVGSAVQAWRSCTLEFIANSAITNLSLKSLAGGPSNGPLVDGVRVEDISISCAGDVDGDGEVGGGDIGLVLLNFGPCPQ